MTSAASLSPTVASGSVSSLVQLRSVVAETPACFAIAVQLVGSSSSSGTNWSTDKHLHIFAMNGVVPPHNFANVSRCQVW